MHHFEQSNGDQGAGGGGVFVHRTVPPKIMSASGRHLGRGPKLQRGAGGGALCS